MDEQREFPFEFSVVMAVYNVEPFLREAVDSLVAQDFGFEKIQLIMVDDGSTDSSGAICDEYAQLYPENVMVIHKENGGVASARNEGLRYATGRYLNFMDSDDKFTQNAFREVHSFFQKNEEETDVVTIPLEFFDALHGRHWQNDKFRRGNRVLDLFWDYQASIMFVNASFFVHSVKDEIIFDPRLVCGEDAKVLLTILIHKMKLGVINTCKYMYRRRSVGEASLIQTSKKKYGWYFDYFTYLIDWAITYYQEKFDYLPAFLQYELLCDLQWRFGQVYDMTEVLTQEGIEQYKARLFQTLENFDDKYILEQKMIWNEHKCYMLSKKYNCPPTLTERHSNVIVHFGNTKINSMADQFSKIEFIRIENGILTIEGFSKVLGVQLTTRLDPYILVNNELVPCNVIQRESINEYRFGELIFRGIAFRVRLPLNLNCEKYVLQLVLKYGDTTIVRRDIRYGFFSPVCRTYDNMYYCHEGWSLQIKGNSLIVARCGRLGHIKHEYKFLKEVWKRNRTGGRKAVIARLIFLLLKLFRSKDIWLISDRIMLTRDNGEAFFRYMMKYHKRDASIYFVLSKKSLDCARMREIGPVVNALSFKHKLLHLLCKYVVSSQADAITTNPFPGYSDNYRDITADLRFIFLQHGVTKDDISDWLNRFDKNIYGFITSGYPEWKSIIDGDYFYEEKAIWLTGFPRFDELYHNEKNIITIMPTWRMYLMQWSGEQGGVWRANENFESSTFCQFYRELLNSTRLIESASKNGFLIHFFPHPNLRSSVEKFHVNNGVKILGPEAIYRDIYAQSNLVVTDYSSACFDFAYLRKPIVYCQFDAEEFFSGKHVYTKGYFDYERDGFGEVEYDLESTVDRIIEYMENGCQLKDKYRERIDKFFAFNDKNNCQRVYEKIMELNGGA